MSGGGKRNIISSPRRAIGLFLGPLLFLLLLVAPRPGGMTVEAQRVAAIAFLMGQHPYFLMLAACVAASLAFMLPVATPPNAVVYGSGRVRIFQMVKAGIWMNLLGILVWTTLMYTVAMRLFGIVLHRVPEWAH